MTPSDAFARLTREGPFVEQDVQWYWHSLSNGFKCMASRRGDCAPTIYHAFHIDDKPIRSKQFFLR